MNLSTKFSELSNARARVSMLARELINELQALANSHPAAGVSATAKVVRVPAAAKAKPAKRRRAKITDAMRADVLKLQAAGKTIKETSKALGISIPSVNNIRHAAKVAPKPAAKPAAPKATKPDTKAKS